jgi:hypothetical protein
LVQNYRRYRDHLCPDYQGFMWHVIHNAFCHQVQNVTILACACLSSIR